MYEDEEKPKRIQILNLKITSRETVLNGVLDQLNTTMEEVERLTNRARIIKDELVEIYAELNELTETVE
ncbi:MAG: hypothetical protein NWE89_04725 [Candidatus Bathyarchaeota archaeon]|nr:hypothetical protein [Candidatus Bathyarchaeota archaeon]